MLADVRDVAIIILATESIIALILVLAILWHLFRLVRFARAKAEEFSVLGRALMESARHAAETAGETATTLKGSADFVSDTVVSPVVQVVSAVAGARSFVAALVGLFSSGKRGGRP